MLLLKRLRRTQRGMTLVEVVIALGIFALALGGVLAALLQSRRLTEGSIAQNTALIIVQGYLEQMKKMEIKDLLGSAYASSPTDTNGKPSFYTAASYKIPTIRGPDTTTSTTASIADSLTVVPLAQGSSAPPTLSSITPGTTPTGAVDNLRNFDMAKDYTATQMSTSDTTATGTTVATQTWTAVWPGATSYPPYTNTDGTTNPNVSSTVGATDLKLNLWIWVKDLTASTPNATYVYGITIIYTYQYRDGARTRYVMGSIRNIRSLVPTL